MADLTSRAPLGKMRTTSPPSVRIEGQAVGGQPGSQVVWALEVEQGNSCGEGCAYGQGFQLLQR